MRTPDDYKRKYKFRTDTTKERRYMNIAIIISLIIVMILWFLIN
jgi:hypothetical protein